MRCVDLVVRVQLSKKILEVALWNVQANCGLNDSMKSELLAISLT